MDTATLMIVGFFVIIALFNFGAVIRFIILAAIVYGIWTFAGVGKDVCSRTGSLCEYASQELGGVKNFATSRLNQR
jgi:hypothetical protein